MLNRAYGIAGQVFGTYMVFNWGSSLSSCIFKSLDLQRNRIRADVLDSTNVARACTALADT